MLLKHYNYGVDYAFLKLGFLDQASFEAKWGSNGLKSFNTTLARCDSRTSAKTASVDANTLAMLREPLTLRTSIEDFRDGYWLQVELQKFCRENNISTVGGKREVADRIEHFLRTGERLTPKPVDTQALAGFRCTQEMRALFTSQLGPNFRFTVPLQRYIQGHPGATLGEIAEEWKRQDVARRTGNLKQEIEPQFQYNQFTRDFFSDPLNRGKSRQECQNAWRRTRDRRGDKKYTPSDGRD